MVENVIHRKQYGHLTLTRLRMILYKIAEECIMDTASVHR